MKVEIWNNRGLICEVLSQNPLTTVDTWIRMRSTDFTITATIWF